MNTVQFVSNLKRLQKKGLNLIKSKNNDYSGVHDAPFRNFDLSADIAGISPEQGLLVRMGDKMTRAGNIISGKEQQIADEKIEDTLLDLSNYALILSSRIKDRENE